MSETNQSWSASIGGRTPDGGNTFTEKGERFLTYWMRTGGPPSKEASMFVACAEDWIGSIVRREIERRHPYPGAHCVYCNAELPHSENGAAAKEHVVKCEKSLSFKLAQTLAVVRKDLADANETIHNLKAASAPKPKRKKWKKAQAPQ